MVISVANTNISESSINEFFHNTEIYVLELCHEYELDLMKSKALNEADEGGEDKTKDSKFAKFIATIKLKIEELARKVTDTVRKIILKAVSTKYNKNTADTIDKNSEVFDIYGLENYIENKKEFKFYNIIKFGKKEISNCKTVEDFMKAFENKRTEINLGNGIITSLSKYDEIIFGSGDNPELSKYIEDIKKDALNQINLDVKNKNISKEESIKHVRTVMNWYTASLKAAIFNTKAFINIYKEYAVYLKAQSDEAKNIGADDED